jgi:hypothetical protein
MKNTLKKKTALRIFEFFIFVIITNIQSAISQGIIIRDNKSTNASAIINKIDPARYEKIMIVNLKVGQCFSDDRGFNSFLKYYNLTPGINNFTDIGAEISYTIKKLNLGFKTDFMFQNNDIQPALWHKNWQLKVGKTLIRNKGLILTLNGNIGAQTSTIKFGNAPQPDFLRQLGYSIEQAKLFQSQFIMGPNISINKMFDKKSEGRGFSIGLESGVNFAAKKPNWKYGYTDAEANFVGETINDMPLAGRQNFYTTLKIGFWSAR